MTDEILVPELCVRVVTGSTLYPSEKGFGALFAEIVTGDKALIATLSKSKREDQTITLRCAMLDAIGHVTRVTRKWTTRKFVVALDDLRFRKHASSSD